MGRLTVVFAMAAGLAAGEDARTQQVKTPAVLMAEQRLNFRATTTAATDGNANAAVVTQTDAEAAGGSRFMSAAATTTTTAAPKPGEGAPFWQPIETTGEPMDYFRYWGPKGATTKEQAASPEFNNEIVKSPTDPHRPLPDQPVVFNFQQSAPIAMETQFAACPFRNQKDVFWFNPYANPDGTHTNLGKDPDNHPVYRYGIPGEWTISQTYNGVRGLSVTSATEGNAPGTPEGGYGVSTTYVTNRRCSDGNDEFGFWKEIASPDKDAKEKDQQAYFYYSVKTNCSAQYGCRASDAWDGPVQDQTTGPLTVLTHVQSATILRRGFAEESASTPESSAEASSSRRPGRPDPERPGQQFTYSAYLVHDDNTSDPDHNTGYKFRVQVTEPDNPSRFAKCSINGGPLQDCQADVPISNWFPARQMQIDDVQVVTGTQTSGVNAPAPLSKDAKFTLKGLSVGK